MIINILIDHKDSFFHDYKDLLMNKLRKLQHKVYFSSNCKKIKNGDLLIIIATKTILKQKYLIRNKLNIICKWKQIICFKKFIFTLVPPLRFTS